MFEGIAITMCRHYFRIVRQKWLRYWLGSCSFFLSVQKRVENIASPFTLWSISLLAGMSGNSVLAEALGGDGIWPWNYRGRHGRLAVYSASADFVRWKYPGGCYFRKPGGSTALNSRNYMEQREAVNILPLWWIAVSAHLESWFLSWACVLVLPPTL